MFIECGLYPHPQGVIYLDAICYVSCGDIPATLAPSIHLCRYQGKKYRVEFDGYYVDRCERTAYFTCFGAAVKNYAPDQIKVRYKVMGEV